MLQRRWQLRWRIGYVGRSEWEDNARGRAELRRVVERRGWRRVWRGEEPSVDAGVRGGSRRRAEAGRSLHIGFYMHTIIKDDLTSIPLKNLVILLYHRVFLF